jgi:hypothetical protein
LRMMADHRVGGWGRMASDRQPFRAVSDPAQLALDLQAVAYFGLESTAPAVARAARGPFVHAVGVAFPGLSLSGAPVQILPVR